jgi:hypothetical protein
MMTIEAWTRDATARDATGTSSSGSLGTNERLRSDFDFKSIGSSTTSEEDKES